VQETLNQLLNEQFQQEAGLCYLNHAAVSPWPRVTAEAVKAFAEENTRIGATHYPRWLRIESELRQRLATLLGLSESNEIALAKSTSEALSMIAYGIEWQPGDEILISSHEFPSNRIVWESLESKGVILRQADFSQASPMEALAKHLNPKTKLVSLSTVQYASGIRLDCEAVAERCREHGALLCLDAIQSLGALPFDQNKVEADFIVADGHKWMMASEGLALFYIKRKHIPNLKLNQYGWHMIEAKGDYSKSTWEAAKDATRFECGSPNMLGIHALHASLGFLLEIGIDVIEEEMHKRVDYLIQALKEIDDLNLLSPQQPAFRGGIVTFSIEAVESTALYQRLMGDQVICANRGGGIRFSPAFYTPYAIIDHAIERLKNAIQAVKPD